MDLFNPISQMKVNGEWPLPWTSAVGLVPHILNLGPDVVGCEVGTSFGFNLYYFFEHLPNLKKVYAIDPYMAYDDGPGGFVTQETSDRVMGMFLTNMEPFKDKLTFIRDTATNAVSQIPDGSLDYIFIDGDHSYDAVKTDIGNYYAKVRSGGIFAGHDFNWNGVRQAVGEFIDVVNLPLYQCENTVWFVIKP